MKKNDSDILLLYSLRFPFTDISTTDIEGLFVDLSVDVKHHFAGSLRVRRRDVQTVLLQGFANTAREVGFLTAGRVTWHVVPELFGFTPVIDQLGNVHNVAQLEAT